jgi:hypothetical protein
MSDNPYEPPQEVSPPPSVERRRSRLGLWLTVLNAGCWVFLVQFGPTLGRGDGVKGATNVAVCVLSFPLALPFILGNRTHAPPSEVMFAICAIALNTFIWGYGLSLLINLVRGAIAHPSPR